MQMIYAIIRPEKMQNVFDGLQEAGFTALSKWEISGRGRQKGIQVGEIFYEQMVKNLIMIVVEDSEKNEVVDIILNRAKTGNNGNSGDGKIFVHPVTESYTISAQMRDDKK